MMTLTMAVALVRHGHPACPAVPRTICASYQAFSWLDKADSSLTRGPLYARGRDTARVEFRHDSHFVNRYSPPSRNDSLNN